MDAPHDHHRARTVWRYIATFLRLSGDYPRFMYPLAQTATISLEETHKASVVAVAIRVTQATKVRWLSNACRVKRGVYSCKDEHCLAQLSATTACCIDPSPFEVNTVSATSQKLGRS